MYQKFWHSTEYTVVIVMHSRDMKAKTIRGPVIMIIFISSTSHKVNRVNKTKQTVVKYNLRIT